jgi:hypothetical protein
LRAGTAGKSSLVTFRISELQFSYHSANIGFMLYEVQSDRQCCGTCSGETHKVVRIDTREVVAVERRRDVAEQICAALDETHSLPELAVFNPPSFRFKNCWP